MGGLALYGLYDIDGILRFTCADREACMAYAELLEIASDEYSLLDLSNPSKQSLKAQVKKGHHLQAKNNN